MATKATKWYCAIGERVLGPMAGGQLRQLAVDGQIDRDSPVRREADDQWFAAGQVQGLWQAEDSGTSGGVKPAGSSNPPVASPLAKPSSTASVNRSGATRSDGSLPTGIPMSSGSRLPVGIALGPAASSIPGPPTSVSTAVVAASSEPDDPIVRRRNRRRTTWMIIGALAVLATFAAVVVVIVGPGGSNRKKPSTADADDGQRNAEPQRDDDQGSADDAESVTASSDDIEPADVRAAAAGDAAADEPSLQETLARRKLENVTRWRDATGTRTIGLRDLVRVRLVDVWISDAARPRAPTDTGSPEPAVAKPHLFVRLVVSNLSASEPLDYRGWNTSAGASSAGASSEGASPGGDPGAVLIDDGRRRLSLAPLDRFASLRRGSEKLGVGQSVTELLVFEAPRGEFRSLRLALPYEAFGLSGKSFGWEVPREFVGDRPPAAPESPEAAGLVGRTVAEPDPRRPAAAETGQSPPKSKQMTDEERLREARDALRRGIDAETQGAKP